MKNDRQRGLELTILICALGLCSGVLAGPQSASIQWFIRSDANPDYPHGAFGAISADSSTAVGRAYLDFFGQTYRGYQPFLCTPANGNVQNIDLPDAYSGIVPGYFASGGIGPSMNATGTTFCATTGSGETHGFAWRSDSGVFDLGTAVGANLHQYGFTHAAVISADGLKIGGTAYDSDSHSGAAAIWTANSAADPTHGSWNVIGTTFNGGANNELFGMNADGTKAVGSLVQNDNSYCAWLWSTTDGVTLIHSVPHEGALNYSEAYAISGNGLVVTGRADDGTSTARAFYWTAANGLQFLATGSPNVDSAGAYPNAVNADGSVIVGATNSIAVIWDNLHGLCDLKEMLAAGGVSFAASDALYGATSVSSDGHTVAGFGVNDVEKGFIAALPKDWIAGKPLINLQPLPNGGGELVIHFVGVLQQCIDLITWQDMSPQPTSPYGFTPSTPRMFFRARLPDGGGLTAPSRRIEAEPQKISSGRSVSAR